MSLGSEALFESVYEIKAGRNGDKKVPFGRLLEQKLPPRQKTQKIVTNSKVRKCKTVKNSNKDLPQMETQNEIIQLFPFVFH
jgi:hypothetical protein